MVLGGLTPNPLIFCLIRLNVANRLQQSVFVLPARPQHQVDEQAAVNDCDSQFTDGLDASAFP